jgi:hypothetical protein
LEPQIRPDEPLRILLNDPRVVESHLMADYTDRRAHPGVKPCGNITAKLVGTPEMFVLDEASVDGFSIHSPKEFVPTTPYRFRVESPSGGAAVVMAVCRRCVRAEHVSDSNGYLVGFEFLPQDTQRLRILLGTIANEAP